MVIGVMAGGWRRVNAVRSSGVDVRLLDYYVVHLRTYSCGSNFRLRALSLWGYSRKIRLPSVDRPHFSLHSYCSFFPTNFLVPFEPSSMLVEGRSSQSGPSGSLFLRGPVASSTLYSQIAMAVCDLVPSLEVCGTCLRTIERQHQFI